MKIRFIALCISTIVVLSEDVIDIQIGNGKRTKIEIGSDGIREQRW